MILGRRVCDGDVPFSIPWTVVGFYATHSILQIEATLMKAALIYSHNCQLLGINLTLCPFSRIKILSSPLKPMV